MSDNKYGVTSYLKKPQSLISFIKNSPDHWLVKDNEARYVFVNNAASEFLDFLKSSIQKEKQTKMYPQKSVKSSGHNSLMAIYG